MHAIHRNSARSFAARLLLWGALLTTGTAPRDTHHAAPVRHRHVHHLAA